MASDILQHPLISSLLDGCTSEYDLFKTYGISVSLEGLVPELLGFTYVSSMLNYYVVINSSVNYEYQQNILAHELKHIIYDVPQMGYIIGIDMQRTTFEKDAKYVGESIVQYLADYTQVNLLSGL